MSFVILSTSKIPPLQHSTSYFCTPNSTPHICKMEFRVRNSILTYPKSHFLHTKRLSTMLQTPISHTKSHPTLPQRGISHTKPYFSQQQAQILSEKQYFCKEPKSSTIWQQYSNSRNRTSDG